MSTGINKMPLLTTWQTKAVGTFSWSRFLNNHWQRLVKNIGA